MKAPVPNPTRFRRFLASAGFVSGWVPALGAAVLAMAAAAACSTPEGGGSVSGSVPGWRLVVLGVAQDGGMPHMGCDQDPCAAARRGERRAEKVACLGITDGEHAYLFDATPDFPAQVHAMGARLPSGVFLTHAHIGHYTGLVHLGKEVAGARGVPLWATAKMREFLAANVPWRALVENGNVDLRDNADVDLGGVRVRAIEVPHRNEYADTVGYLIEGPRARALYIPDIDRWEPWDRDIRALVESVDVALLDATFASGEELPGRDMSRVPHPLVGDTMARLAGLGERVRLIHLNHTNPLLVDPKSLKGNGFRVAREGERFDL
jgi:pyrroloquinoline quinone biosynthesis protein B